MQAAATNDKTPSPALPPSDPDRKQQAEQFLNTLFEGYRDREHKGVICIVGIEQPKPADRSQRIQEKFFASIDAAVQALPELEAWHAVGLDIYVCANPLSTSHRSAENVDAQVCVHVDLDNTQDLPPCPLEPSLVQSSGHGLQLFWVLDAPYSLSNSFEPIARIQRNCATNLNKRFAAMLGGDHCHDLARLMRLPGFSNHKREPVPVRLVSASGKRYSAVELEAACDAHHPSDDSTTPQRKTQPPAHAQADSAEPKPGDGVAPSAEPEPGGNGTVIRSSVGSDEAPLSFVDVKSSALKGLGPELAVKFEKAMAANEWLRRRWAGDRAGLNDTSDRRPRYVAG